MTGRPAPRWTDLRARALSGVAMLAVGGVAIWAGGVVFAALVLLVTGLMVWELARMTAAPGAVPAGLLGLLAAVVLLAALWLPAPAGAGLLLLPAVIGTATPRRDRAAFFPYAVLLMAAGFGFWVWRETGGVAGMAWLLAVVVASDVLGYFVGRSLGGPKFWPSISPKKTWSGTVAGWIGALAVGLAFWAAGLGGGHLVWASPLLAFAGQMGDIAESAIKRRAGVKDSSNLIPGHGGVLDRGDALAGAVIPLLLGQMLWGF